MALKGDEARKLARSYIESAGFELDVEYPALIERFRVWKAALKHKGKMVGEVAVNSETGDVDFGRSTNFRLLKKRIETAEKSAQSIEKAREKRLPHLSVLPNIIGMGDSEELLASLPEESVDLIFTSPPYYNVKPEYQEYIDYDDYLEKMRRIFIECNRVLHEGRFFAINVSMALSRRPSSKESSVRIPIPFDMHRILSEEDFVFVDDIIWEKPEGAGWVSGRGRNFVLNRKPLAYKPVPVTEYILVYRKKSEHTLGWNISGHPDQQAVEESKILHDNYEKTNVWKISPSHDREHPAPFPRQLARNIIEFYSFKKDVVLDPFGGVGTTALACLELERRFVYFEQNEEYVRVFQNRLAASSMMDIGKVEMINAPAWTGGFQLKLL